MCTLWANGKQTEMKSTFYHSFASIGFVKSDGYNRLCVGYRCASSAFKSGNELFVTHRTWQTIVLLIHSTWSICSL